MKRVRAIYDAIAGAARFRGSLGRGSTIEGQGEGARLIQQDFSFGYRGPTRLIALKFCTHGHAFAQLSARELSAKLSSDDFIGS